MGCGALDIEHDPCEQGFDLHSFDLIVAADVLHATKDLRHTVEQVKRLLGCSGTLLLVEITCMPLILVLIFGLLKGWWLFQDGDLRQGQPSLSQKKWKSLLNEAGFSDLVLVADCPDATSAPLSVIIARGPQLPASAVIGAPVPGAPRTWLLLTDHGSKGGASAGADLAFELEQRGDRVIRATHGAVFEQRGSSHFTIRASNSDDFKRLMCSVRDCGSRLAGVVHLWSLDIAAVEAMTNDALVCSALLGCIGALQLIQAIVGTEGLVVDGLWLVTRSAQALEGRGEPVEAAQSPLWGFGRGAVLEIHNLRCRLIDLTTCSHDEVRSLADELSNPDVMEEDEIALHGELRYVRRLVPALAVTGPGSGGQAAAPLPPFRIQFARSGILDAFSARHLVRRRPEAHEVEIEIAATGLNFKDLMLVMGMLPNDLMADDPAARPIGSECAGRVVAVGSGVTKFDVGDEVMAIAEWSLASHVTTDARRVMLKPPHLSLEQAATIPVAFMTAFHSLHTLGQLQPGERVLIHSGTGGVGLAAVQLALQARAVVFATAGTPEKRELLTALGASYVMDSRTLAFADEVLELTGGAGIDLVLNSLPGEAVDKGLSILRTGGRFIEIGRLIHENRRVGMRPLRKNLSLMAVDLSSLLKQRPELFQSLARELFERFSSNELRPLSYHAFPVARLAQALHEMARAKHIGKLVVASKDTAGLRIARDSQPVTIHADASYLISGGLGGFGLAVADHLAQRGARRLALVGRRGPSPFAQAAVDSLRQRGIEVMVCQADIADRAQTQRVIADVQRIMGPLRGIIHAAGVLDDASMKGLTEARMWKVMAPKIMGAWNLHALTAEAPVDFFVLFSSIASILGSPGQANYAAGNAFMDALAHYRRARGLPALAVNWGRVGEVGRVAASPELAERLERFGMKAMPIAQMLDRLEELMSSDAVQATVARVEWKELLQSGIFARIPGRFADLIGELDTEEEGRAISRSYISEILEADTTTLPPLLANYVRDRLAQVTRVSTARIDSQQPLFSLGLDSLMVMEVRNRINADLGVNVPLAKFTQNATIGTLAAYIAERLRDGARSESSGIVVIATSAAAHADSLPTDENAEEDRHRIDLPARQVAALEL